jgi:DNA-binding XRE family transcriptional regulator
VTPAEFRCQREYLGLPLGWMAQALGVAERTVNRWESGVTPVPERAALAMAQLSDYTRRCVDKLASPRNRGKPLTTTADDERPIETWGLPASWHRMMCARVAAETGRHIEYSDGPLTDAGLTPVLDRRAWRTVVAR